MQVIRVSYLNHTFYARLEGKTVICLDRNKGLDQHIPLTEVAILPIAVPSKIVCLAKNYPKHAAELGGEVPSEPLLFLKPPTTVIGPGNPILIPPGVGRVDFEGELAVVIGRACRNLSPKEVPSHIFGYTCANDITARDLQKKDGLFARAKGFDTFAPVGPWIETELTDPMALRLRTMVNGTVQQDASTSEMFFSPFEAISFISRVMTLLPGDIVLTGTPDGIGPIVPGDEVTVEIEGLGHLSNKVLATPDQADTEDSALNIPLQ